MSGVNYTTTFIAVADDCPVDRGTVPPERGGKPTIAGVEFALLEARPYGLTSEDVIFESSSVRRVLGERASRKELARAREEFFRRPQACLRASPLPKKFGWGVHCDEHGRVALHGMETDEYARLTGEPSITQLKAMRSSRC